MPSIGQRFLLQPLVMAIFITTLGRIITMVSSFMGIAIVALPASIITAGYMKEIESDKI